MSHILIILAADDDVRMLCVQCAFKHGKGAPKKHGCLFCTALLFVEHAKVVDRQSHLNVIAAEDVFFDGQGATVYLLGLSKLTACLMQRGKQDC